MGKIPSKMEFTAEFFPSDRGGLWCCRAPSSSLARNLHILENAQYSSAPQQKNLLAGIFSPKIKKRTFCYGQVAARRGWKTPEAGCLINETN